MDNVSDLFLNERQRIDSYLDDVRVEEAQFTFRDKANVIIKNHTIGFNGLNGFFIPRIGERFALRTSNGLQYVGNVATVQSGLFELGNRKSLNLIFVEIEDSRKL